MDAVRVRFDERARWLVMDRGDIRVAVNLAPHAQDLPAGGTELVLGSDADIRPGADFLRMAPDSAAVLSAATAARRGSP
jgi:maltooligosyltrehalose trehalohydrolase